MAPYRVIQWGVGGVGTWALRQVLDASGLELVGVKCGTAAKVGVDAGELAGREPVGVLATTDVDELLALEADAVVFMPRVSLKDPTIPGSPAAAWVDELVPVLESGKNVVSPIAAAMHYRHLADGASLIARLNAACAKGGSSVFFTGVDPGFICDALAAVMTSSVAALSQVRTWEFIDYSNYPVPAVMNELGFGMRPQDLDATMMESLRASWGCAPWLIADALGVELEDIRLDADFYLSPRTFTVAGGTHIEAGTIGATLWSLAGVVDGEDRITINHVNRMGADMAPDWPTIGDQGGYRIEMDAMPPYRGDFPLGQPGGTGTALDDAVVMTAARCVNSIAAVVQAAPGYQTLNDLPAFGGRYGLRASKLLLR
jgi:4-hydroxy-tetrahydrodipicolinate reductase